MHLRFVLAGAAALVSLLTGCPQPARSTAASEPSSPPALSDVVASIVGSARASYSGYELDGKDRSPPLAGQKRVCDASELVSYRGLVLHYDGAVSVHPAFAERLIRFERVVREVATEVYGRPPRLLHQAGAFACRTTVTGRRFSEHAFGNALDVEGFSFDALDKTGAAKLAERGVEIEAGARRAFRVRVGQAWKDGAREIDKRFFRLLIERLRARQDVFRAVIGPGDPAHETHLHLDVGPWSYSRVEAP